MGTIMILPLWIQSFTISFNQLILESYISTNCLYWCSNRTLGGNFEVSNISRSPFLMVTKISNKISAKCRLYLNLFSLSMRPVYLMYLCYFLEKIAPLSCWPMSPQDGCSSTFPHPGDPVAGVNPEEAAGRRVPATVMSDSDSPHYTKDKYDWSHICPWCNEVSKYWRNCSYLGI